MKIYTFNDKVLTRNTRWLKEYEEPTPPTPSLPPYTIRMKFTEGVTPTFNVGSLVQVSSSPNIWDLTYAVDDWSGLSDECDNKSDIEEIIDINASGVINMRRMFSNCASITSAALSNTSSVTNMGEMFNGCTSLASVTLFDTSSVTDMNLMFCACASLTSIPLFNTSNVTNMRQMLFNCTSLTSLPLFDTSSVTNMFRTFMRCYNVQSGALALYQQASTQSTPPSNHESAFEDCGSNTDTGAAELAQIPYDWGGAS